MQKLWYPSWQVRISAVQQQVPFIAAETEYISSQPSSIVFGDRFKLSETRLTAFAGPTLSKMWVTLVGQVVTAVFFGAFLGPETAVSQSLLGTIFQLFISITAVGFALKNEVQFDVERRIPFCILLENEDRCSPILSLQIRVTAFRRIKDLFNIRRWIQVQMSQFKFTPQSIARRIFLLAKSDAAILAKSLAFTSSGDLVVRGRWGRSSHHVIQIEKRASS